MKKSTQIGKYILKTEPKGQCTKSIKNYGIRTALLYPQKIPTKKD